MRARPLRILRAALALALLVPGGCSVLRPAPPAASAQPAPPAPSGVSRPPGAPPAPAAPPRDAAPSGVLYRVGLKSDAAELAFGPPGQRWTVVSGGRAETIRSPLKFRPEARGAAAPGFTVQAGAFSQEERAKQTLDRLTAQFQIAGTIAFSAERGVYRVLLGSFPDRAAADSFVERLRGAGIEAISIEGTAGSGGPPPPSRVLAAGEEGSWRALDAPVDVYPADADARVVFDGKPYRGSLRVAVNARGALNLINRVDLEEYLFGVVPAEMGPKRYDELEALKAQAVAARTYALAHRGQFESDGYDLCATPKCQVYSGASAEDPLSTAAVEATRGLVLAWQGRFADALFVSTCGGRTDNVANVFGEPAAPYLVPVDCGELETTAVPGAPLPRSVVVRERSGLEWRGYVLERHAPRRKTSRAVLLELAQEWAGVRGRSAPPPALTAAAVYPSLIASFALERPRELHLLPREERYYSEPPAVSGRLSGSARDAYDFLLRFRFGAGEPLPPPDRAVTDEEYAGLLVSAALRLSGVTESSGKFLRREGANVWVKTAEGTQGLPVDPELPLARRVGDRFFVAPALELRAGDRLRWWKRGSRALALWVELDAAGPSFERESSWTEWVRRVSGRELARRMATRVPGSEVRDLEVLRRTDSGRVVELKVRTDAGETTLTRFDVRQALELPELLFSIQRATGPQGESEFVFLGRGWGHGVGLCQNGSYGMALAGATYDQILRHYYVGVDIVAANTVQAGPPSGR